MAELGSEKEEEKARTGQSRQLGTAPEEQTGSLRGAAQLRKWLGGGSPAAGGGDSSAPQEPKLAGEMFKQIKSPLRATWIKRWFVLSPHYLQCFRVFPHLMNEFQIPLRVYHLDASWHLKDLGRETYKNEELFTFSIQISNSKSVVLGCKSPELAAKWMEAIGDNVAQSIGRVSSRQSLDAGECDSDDEESLIAESSLSIDSIPGGESEPLLRSGSEGEGAAAAAADVAAGQGAGVDSGSIKGLTQAKRMDRRASMGPRGPPVELGGMLETMVAMKSASSVSGIAADGSWQLVKLANGLRFFEERSEVPNVACGWVPCMSAVGSVEAPSDAIFRLIMDLKATRLEWDMAYEGARVVEEQDGHTDVIHYRMKPLPLGLGPLAMGARDLCVRRYWQRTPDGCYVILYQSIEHRLCPPSGLCVRANLTYGGFIIAPLDEEESEAAKGRSLVMHMLKLEPNGWLPKVAGYPTNVHVYLLSRVAGIREFFAQSKSKAISSLFGALKGTSAEGSQPESATSAASDHGVEASGVIPLPAAPHPKRPSLVRSITQAIPVAAPFLGFSKRIESKKVVDEWSWAEKAASLAKGSPSAGINAWSEADFANFALRSKTYLQDKVKEPASPPFMSLVAVDWLTRKDRIDHVVGLRPTPVQAAREKLAQGSLARQPFFFVVNMQVPAVQFYSMVFYFVMDEKPSPDSLMGQFIDGDDVFRNTRFKLIPRIHEGAWVVKRSVGTTPVIVGNALTVRYHSGPDYLECDIDIGSSSVANGIVKFVLGYVRSIVVDMAFLFQGNSEEELPEKLLGTVRVMHLEPESAVEVGELEAEELEQSGRLKED